MKHSVAKVLLIFMALSVLMLSGCGKQAVEESNSELSDDENSELSEIAEASNVSESSLSGITPENDQLFGAIVDEIDSIVLKEHIFTESDDYVIVVKEITDENEITKVLSFFNGWVAEENIGEANDGIATHMICFGDVLTFEYFYNENKDSIVYRDVLIMDSGDNLPEIFKTEHYYVVPEEFAEYIDRIILAHSYFEDIE